MSALQHVDKSLKIFQSPPSTKVNKLCFFFLSLTFGDYAVNRLRNLSAPLYTRSSEIWASFKMSFNIYGVFSD